MHIALDRAGKEIWATFGPGLDKLTKPIGDLSQGIVASTKVFIGSGGFNLAISAATVGLQKFDDLLNGKSKPGGKPSGKPPTPSDAGKGQVTPDVSGKLPALFTAPLAEKAWAWTKSELPWTAA
ncbi:MAG: hypothetical protein ACREDL_08385, partial [Bradyrhizobium sp.]